jgi:hypothetical protein
MIAETISSGLGLSMYDIIVLLVALSCVIIAAKSVLVSIMYAVLMFLSLFMVYYEAHTFMGMTEVNFTLPLVGFIMSIMLLSIVLLVEYKNGSGSVA